MSVTLYKPGKAHTIRGIKCETQTFNEYSYLHNLEDGWFYSPEECHAAVEVVEPEAKKLNLDEMGGKEIRQHAKEIGIKNYYNKGVSKLKLEIEEWQPEI